MTYIRFTVARLMAIVICFGSGFAALRIANAAWASAVYTLAVVLIVGALVGALVRKGPARAAWVGFAVSGWTMLLIVQLPEWQTGGLGFGPIPRPPLLFEWCTARLQPYIKPIPPGAVGAEAVNMLTPYEQISQSLGIILIALAGAVLGRFLAAKNERPEP